MLMIQELFTKKRSIIHIPCNGTVVVVIDMQPNFYKELWPTTRKRILNHQLGLIASCKKNNVPVVVVEFWCTLSGESLGETIPEIKQAVMTVPRHYIERKDTNDAFNSADFQARIKMLAPKRLVLAGINASYCVLETAEGATQRGIPVATASTLIADGYGCSNNRPDKWFRKNGTYARHLSLALG